MKKIIITMFAFLVWMATLPCVHAEEDFRVLVLNKFGEPYKKFVFDNEEAWAYKGSPEKITIQGLEVNQFTLYRFGKRGELHSKYTVDENYVKDLEVNGPKILNKFVGAVVGEALDDRIYISEATLDVIKAKKATSGTKGPPVDLNKPVENPALKTATRNKRVTY